jgi:hypothetical protein
MFLTEEQAAIIIIDRSQLTNISPSELKYQLERLKDPDKGKYCCVILDTGARLHYSKPNKAFYISGNHSLFCDTLSIYYHLGILEDYYSWFLRNRKSVSKEIELAMRKRAYKQYKLERLQSIV